MGAEHSQQRVDVDANDLFESRDLRLRGGNQAFPSNTNTKNDGIDIAANNKRRNVLRHQNSGGIGTNSSVVIASKQILTDAASPTSSELSRPPSPPLSVCSDLPYISYTDRPIGDSPKIRNKQNSSVLSQQTANRCGASTVRNGKSQHNGIKPKRPQSTSSSHSIVIVKPGARDQDFDIDPELARLRNIPQFLPVLRDTIKSAAFTRDAEILERLHSQHLINICGRMQTHLNLCATHIANEQNHLVERTKIVSNSITTLFASFVDMQKTYAAYAEQFVKIRAVSQQLSRCNSLLHENIASLESINNFLDTDDRLESFVWRTDDNKLRGEAEGAAAAAAAAGNRSWRL